MSEEGDATVWSSCAQDTPVPVPVPVPVIITMANMINYLSASMYQGLFTYTHERAWARLNEIYTFISNTPNAAPSIDIVEEFCSCVASLEKVIDTDDGDYYNYMRILRKYYTSSSAITVSATPAAASEKEPPSSSSWYYNDSDADSDGELEIDMMRREMTEWTAQIRWRNR
jgi:hypothetical protein